MRGHAEPLRDNAPPRRSTPAAPSGPLAEAANAAPRAQSLVQMQSLLNGGERSRSLRSMHDALNASRSTPVLQGMFRRRTRSQNPELVAMQDTPRSGGGSFLNLLPREDENTPMEYLTNATEMLEQQVGYFAPNTVSYSSGRHPVTAHSRPRQSNEQGVGFRNLAQQYFPPAQPFPNTARTANTMMASYPDAPLLPGMQGNIQSLHSMARSVGPVVTAFDPFNYSGGTREANLLMTGEEHALGGLQAEQRRQFEMETTVYSDPHAPLAHGINMQIYHQNYEQPVLTANYSGYQTAVTQEEVRRNLEANRQYLQWLPQHGGLHYSEDEVATAAPQLGPEEVVAMTQMLNMSHMVQRGTNPWQQNAVPLEFQEDEEDFEEAADDQFADENEYDDDYDYEDDDQEYGQSYDQNYDQDLDDDY